MNYRTFFKKHYGIDFSDDYDVHHIDLNHNNNDINNLMVMPKKLHNKYHICLTAMGGNDLIKSFDARIYGSALNSNNYNIEMLQHLIESLKECNKWYDYKMYLDGIIDNIHNIDIRRQNNES